MKDLKFFRSSFILVMLIVIGCNFTSAERISDILYKISKSVIDIEKELQKPRVISAAAATPLSYDDLSEEAYVPPRRLTYRPKYRSYSPQGDGLGFFEGKFRSNKPLRVAQYADEQEYAALKEEQERNLLQPMIDGRRRKEKEQMSAVAPERQNPAAPYQNPAAPYQNPADGA